MEVNEGFKTIGLIGRTGSELVVETLHQLIEFLDARGITMVIDEASSELLPGDSHQVGSRKMMGEICDLVVVVGGDG